LRCCASSFSYCDNDYYYHHCGCLQTLAARWRPLNLLLGSAVAAFLVGGMGDWRVERVKRSTSWASRQ